ncbi:MAG: hypothetical protein RL582_189 [Bacteroidota bacterium]
MDEYLLQYIWESRYFNASELRSTDGQPLQIIDPGKLNSDQGPDFLFAKVRIGDMLMMGHIEIHVKASDWILHRHTGDPHYKNVILHVVWQNDKSMDLPFPTLELQSRISKIGLAQYQHLKDMRNGIPCEKLVKGRGVISLDSFAGDLVIERFEMRARQILSYLPALRGNWEELAWRKLAYYLGGNKNGEAMEVLFASIPFRTMMSCANNRKEIEAILFGQAGLLHPGLRDSYPNDLYKEYKYLKQKYQLEQPQLQWMFFRMRPSNFPTLRIAQLAAILNTSKHLMGTILSEKQNTLVKDLFSTTVSSYWTNHFTFDKVSSFQSKNAGAHTQDKIMVNVIAPLMYAYGTYHNVTVFKKRAAELLLMIKPEENKITKTMNSLGFSNANAFDSQALTQLNNSYCNAKKCLQCYVGISLIRSDWGKNQIQ